MPSAFIVKRPAGWHVRYRLGGRETRPVHWSAHKRKWEAEEARDYLARELAEGRIPIRASTSPAATPLAVVALDWLDTRVDVSPRSRDRFKIAIDRLGPLGPLSPGDVTVKDIQAWVSHNASLKQSSLRAYLSAVRQILDFADVDPNPAYDRRVKLPPQPGKDVRRILTRQELDSVIDRLALPYRPAVQLIRETGARVHEALDVRAEHLASNNRVLINGSKTKAAQRWAWVSPQLHQFLADHDGPSVGFTRRAVGNALARAAVKAGLPAQYPHSLRHRFGSILVAKGVDPVTVATLLGHSRPSMSLDVYSHQVVPNDVEDPPFLTRDHA